MARVYTYIYIYIYQTYRRQPPSCMMTFVQRGTRRGTRGNPLFAREQSLWPKSGPWPIKELPWPNDRPKDQSLTITYVPKDIWDGQRLIRPNLNRKICASNTFDDSSLVLSYLFPLRPLVHLFTLRPLVPRRARSKRKPSF